MTGNNFAREVAMNENKVKDRENRLSRAKAQVEARQKALKERGLDESLFKKDSMLRHLQAKVRKVRRSIESLKREPLKVEKPKAPDKKAAKQKAPKAPKEKKPKKEEPKKEKAAD